MMDKLWVVLLVALTGVHLGHGSPVRSTPHSYPHNTNGPVPDGWTDGNLYAAVPALALVITAVGLLIGCTWCYRHKDCKQNEGADNQLFTASATHLHERRSHPPDSGFSEPANNNISEDNNNGPISLREMQNIANNNAAAYIVSENEERNRVSRESVVEFEPLPTGIRVADPLERCVDWFGDEDFPRNRLQYLREIGRGSFGRVVEGEIEDEGTTTTVAVKILNQNASLEDKARFLEEARLYRDSRHENVLAFVASCLQEDPWILIFELCQTDLQTYLTVNRPKMTELNENGVPLRLMCDITAALSYLHSRGNTYGYICANNVLVRGEEENARAVLGHYGLEPRPQSPEHLPAHQTESTDVQSLGTLIWEICAWGAPAPRAPPPDLNCPYREHLYQVMQLCWSANPAERPTASQAHALLNHLYTTHVRSRETSRDDGYGSSDFEERWQRLKPNTIPKIDEHVAIVHAPSTSMTSHFTGSEEFEHTVQDSLSVDLDATAVSRSSSMMSDKDPLSVQIKSESLTNLHGSLEDVGNIYLTHNERAVQDCHQGNVGLEEEQDRSDASVDPWLKEIIAGNQDDDGYYRDVSDVIKNLDNILNSEKTSSSESSHQASPSRDNLSLDCKKDYPMQSSMVKSPGISNFQNILEIGFEGETSEKKQDEDEDKDTIGTLSHSFERHSDTISQQTLENLTPDTPIKDMDLPCDERIHADLQDKLHAVDKAVEVEVNADLPKESKIDDSFSVLPNLIDLRIASVPSVNEAKSEVSVNEDCQSRGDNNLADIVSDKETVEAKSICEVIKDPIKSEIIEEVIAKNVQSLTESSPVHVQNKVLPVVSDIVENERVPLPISPLEDIHKDTSEFQSEPTRTNSQKDINNDLITPAESTTDSKITSVVAVCFETESAPKIELIENVSKIPESIHRKEEAHESELPSPMFDLKEETLPETVQNNTTCITSPDSNILEAKGANDLFSELVSEPEALTFKAAENEPVQLGTAKVEAEKIRILRLETPILVLPEPLDEIQNSKDIDCVPEEFVEKIIKEAETAALNSIETGEAKIATVDPESISVTKELSISTFLENEIRAAEIDSLNNIAFQEHLAHTFKKSENKEDPLSIFLEKELKDTPKRAPEDGSLDNITRKILIEAMQDVPKAMDKGESPLGVLINDVDEMKNNKSEIENSTSEKVNPSLIMSVNDIEEQKNYTPELESRPSEKLEPAIDIEKIKNDTSEIERSTSEKEEPSLSMLVNDIEKIKNDTSEIERNTSEKAEPSLSMLVTDNEKNKNDTSEIERTTSEKEKPSLSMLVNDIEKIKNDTSEIERSASEKEEPSLSMLVNDIEKIKNDTFEIERNTSEKAEPSLSMLVTDNEKIQNYTSEIERSASEKEEPPLMLVDNVKEIKQYIPEIESRPSEKVETTLVIDDKEIKNYTPDVESTISEKAQPSLVKLVNDVEEIKSNTPDIESSTSENIPDIVQDVAKFTEPPILQRQEKHMALNQNIAPTLSVVPQTSLDIESTLSADSSTSTFLVSEVMTEQCKSVVAEDPKATVLGETIQQITSHEVNAEPILSTDSINNTSDDVSKKLSPSNVIPQKDDNLIANVEEIAEKDSTKDHNTLLRSDESKTETVINEQSNNSTTYMDLTDGVKTVTLFQNPVDKDLQEVINSCLNTSETEAACSLVKNESTVYLDLPNVIHQMDDFLLSERQFSTTTDGKDPIYSSTPKSLADDAQKLEQDKSDVLSETKVPDYGPGVTLTKLDQQCVPDSMSPFESPTKSHPTDTYDENSSVVLGPFENCTMELFKGAKSATDVVDVPKDELLAFSSNFSEMNLETPSPLRDGNFLNEVPDIVHDDVHFDDITSENKDETDANTDVSDATDKSVTEKRVSPSTPPNSPGYFLASTSQQKYLVDIDLNHPTEPVPVESDSGLSSLHKEIELNQIELQITSKLAMAENENNLNIEYSGPLTVEGLVQDDLDREEEATPETFLAGNGGGLENVRETFTLDEECVNALRNELELKLPLAQVAAIEPQCESEGDNSWSSELPPPPELIVSYPGALSPIAEETGPQLSAYENDAQWNTSIRTDSSESYPEPCNNSTDEVTELPTGQNTYTLASRLHTYTVQRDANSSKEITMSADSLNGSPRKSNAIDDRTFTKEDDIPCERISQVSPFILSPTTDTSAPDNSDVTGVSTLSKTTVPTDAKISKPSETQCLSKATSIDSWCSNDTLYNVEEAFDDLASDPEIPADFDLDKEQDNSESSHTLTVNDEKELSHVSTYIVHDSQSDEDRFSPDSITANDHENYTYTKVKTDVETSPSVITKSEVNDSKTQTKDLAYGTLLSGVPSYSNCTTEVLSGDNGWLVPHPEMVRRSPVDDGPEISATVNMDEKKLDLEDSPQLKNEPCLKKMDSVEISCLGDHFLESSPEIHGTVQTEFSDSPNYQYNMAETVTSTPLTEVPCDGATEPIIMTLPEDMRTPDNLSSLPNLHSFLYSAELRPQDRSFVTNENRAVVSEGDSTRIGSDATPSYTEFEHAAMSKPQETSRLQSSQNGSDDYRKFENSVRERPQDMSNSASEMLLKAERGLADKEGFVRPSQPSKSEPTSLVISPPSITNLRESHVDKVNTVIITDLEEDETEQPHSIIIAEVSKESQNRTFDSHILGEFNQTYDSHPSRRQKDDAFKESNSDNSKELTVNGLDDQSHDAENIEAKSPETKAETPKESTQIVNNTTTLRDIPNGSVSSLIRVNNAFDIKCNGNSEKFATVNFLNESFEELVESNVDDGDKDVKSHDEDILELSKEEKVLPSKEAVKSPEEKTEVDQETVNGDEEKVVTVTENFLENEKKFCRLDAYLPLLSDIRFTGPASEIMSTSFTQESPTEPAPDRDDKPGGDIKEWDSDSDSHSTNSSSGEFIWKGGDGQETSVVPSTHFDHRGSTGGGSARGEGAGGASSGESGSGSGSEGDEVEFVPSSWDCRAEPAKSSLRSLANSQDNKKRVVFKRQKYHCVYEYPRELAPLDTESPAYLPDLSTYTEWDTTSAEEAELGYGQLFGGHAPLDLYPIRGTVGFGAEYDDEFFVTPSARPFESLGVFSTTSQFFPGGMALKPPLPLSDHLPEDFPPPLSPTTTHPLAHTRTPSLDFTTPDSGVEDITPGSTSTDEDFKTKKLHESEVTQWRSIDSGSSSESVSPSSPGGEALGGLRHTRDKLKLDLPPSPHIPSPRHNRVFNFVLDKPKRHRVPDEKPVEIGTTPLVMTDETPVVSTSLPLQKDCEDVEVPEPTFSTFGKCAQKTDSEQKIILSDDVEEETGEVKASPVKVEAVKGEGTVLDSGDEDSGIESSSKATLERNKTPNVS